MSEHATTEGIDYGPLAALIGTLQGDKGGYQHKDVNTLQRTG